MRNLKRNEKPFEYLPWTGAESDLNSNGEHTGEFYPVYGDPVPYRGNISMPSGQAIQTFYGLDARYTHVLVLHEPDADIREQGQIRYNGRLYDITAVRPSLNVLSVALRQKTEDHASEMPYVPDPEPDGNDGDGE